MRSNTLYCATVLVAWLSTVSTAITADPQSGPKLEEVIVVFKTHFDIGYTDLARNVINRYRTSMIDNALATCDGAKTLPPEHRFVWTLAGWPMQQVLWPGQTSERRARSSSRSATAGWSGTPCPPAYTPNRSTWKTWSCRATVGTRSPSDTSRGKPDLTSRAGPWIATGTHGVKAHLSTGIT